MSCSPLINDVNFKSSNKKFARIFMGLTPIKSSSITNIVRFSFRIRFKIEEVFLGESVLLGAGGAQR